MQVNSYINQNTNSETSVKIFHFNDVHGRLAGSERLKIASDTFDAKNRNSTQDIFKFSAGDIGIGQKFKKNQLMMEFLNLMNIDCTVLGNHEFDMGTKKLSELIDKTRFKVLGMNINHAKGGNLEDDVNAQRLVRSYVAEKNGHKYGIVGLIPMNFKHRISKTAQQETKDITIDDFEQSKKELQEEVDKFRQQGINKIFLISHIGYDADTKIAQQVSGIDVIIGGHSHTELNGVKPNENYFINPEGEPVLITQAGQNGNKYGIIDVAFDSMGRIKNAMNKLYETTQTPKSLIVKHFESIFMGKPQEIGTLKNTFKPLPEGSLIESAAASMVADSIRYKSGADIAFSNIAGTKGELEAGTITDRDILELMPYCNKVKKYKYTEKDIIDVLNGGIQAVLNPPHRTGAIQVSGLKYTIDKNNKLKEALFENADGTLTPLNIQNPSTEKTFTVVYNTYLEGGPEHVEMLNAPEKVIESYEWTDTDAVTEVIKSLGNNPFELVPDGRIIKE